MCDNAGDLSDVPYRCAGAWGRSPGAEACFVLSRRHRAARAAFEAAAVALKEFERGIECEGGSVPEDEAERGKDVVRTGCGGREVVLAKQAVILGADSPNIQMSAPELDGISIP